MFSSIPPSLGSSPESTMRATSAGATYVGVNSNYDSFPATARQYGVQSIPTDVIITPQGQLIEWLAKPVRGQILGSGSRVATIAHGGRTGRRPRQRMLLPPTGRRTAWQPDEWWPLFGLLQSAGSTADGSGDESLPE